MINGRKSPRRSLQEVSKRDKISPSTFWVFCQTTCCGTLPPNHLTLQPDPGNRKKDRIQISIEKWTFNILGRTLGVFSSIAPSELCAP